MLPKLKLFVLTMSTSLPDVSQSCQVSCIALWLPLTFSGGALLSGFLEAWKWLVFHTLYISFQILGIFLAHMPFCRTDIFPWLQLMNCSHNHSVTVHLIISKSCLPGCLLTSFSGLSVLQLSLPSSAPANS